MVSHFEAPRASDLRHKPATVMMMTLDAFKLALEDVLHHLYDPDHAPGHLLCEVMGCDPQAEPQVVQARMRQAIEALKPTATTPAGSRMQRAYETLYHRFVLGLTHDETAEALHTSPRTVQRIQREAIHTLAVELWEARYGESHLAGAIDWTAEEAADDGTPTDWQAQAALELASLRASAPDRAADVAEVLHGLLELEEVLTAGTAVTLAVKYVQPGLVAAVHPTALRQTLIAAASRLVRRMAQGQVAIYAGLEDGNVRITLTATVNGTAGEPTEVYTREILVPAGGTIEATTEGDRVYIYVRAPSTAGIRVLAVDDNVDMIHYYHRCTAGTAYQIVEASTGQEALASIAKEPPDLILLDVMLPDTDGWTLLMHLHEDLATRRIPVIVCTVIREEALAFSLGAAGFLSKPVQPRALVEALDRAYHRVTAGSERAPASM